MEVQAKRPYVPHTLRQSPAKNVSGYAISPSYQTGAGDTKSPPPLGEGAPRDRAVVAHGEWVAVVCQTWNSHVPAL